MIESWRVQHSNERYIPSRQRFPIQSFHRHRPKLNQRGINVAPPCCFHDVRAFLVPLRPTVAFAAMESEKAYYLYSMRTLFWRKWCSVCSAAAATSIVIVTLCKSHTHTYVHGHREQYQSHLFLLFRRFYMHACMAGWRRSYDNEATWRCGVHRGDKGR